MEIFFRFFYAGRGESCGFGLLIYNIIGVAVFLIVVFLFIQFCYPDHFQGLGETVRDGVHLRGFIPLPGNDQGGSGFIDQNGVHFVHDSERVSTLYFLLFIGDHIITQIIKSQLIISTISNIRFVCLFTGVVIQVMYNQANCQAQKAVYFAHFLRVTAG